MLKFIFHIGPGRINTISIKPLSHRLQLSTFIRIGLRKVVITFILRLSFVETLYCAVIKFYCLIIQIFVLNVPTS